MISGVLGTDNGLKEFCCAGVHDPDEAADTEGEFDLLLGKTGWYSTKSPSPASSPSESTLIGSSGMSSEYTAGFELLISRLDASLPGPASDDTFGVGQHWQFEGCSSPNLVFSFLRVLFLSFRWLLTTRFMIGTSSGVSAIGLKEL